MRRQDEHLVFSTTRQARNEKCLNKDTIVRNCLSGVKIKKPKSLFALLMPAKWGIEKEILNRLGVPNRNIFTIERVPSIWLYQKRLGLQVTPYPMDAELAIEFIDADRKALFDLIYLDFFSRPTFSQHRVIKKIFAYRMLKVPGGTLMLTFGKNRSRQEVREWTSAISDPNQDVPTKKIVQVMINKYGYPTPKILKDFVYISKTGRRYLHYVTTLVKF
jgi:hypothetical protein